MNISGKSGFWKKKCMTKIFLWLPALRTQYNDKRNLFLEDSIEVKEPFHLFEKWFSEVRTNPTVVEPNAMCLSTATK
jgi:pyridoxamine 5'-phosphate oxidase